MAPTREATQDAFVSAGLLKGTLIRPGEQRCAQELREDGWEGPRRGWTWQTPSQVSAPGAGQRP